MTRRSTTAAIVITVLLTAGSTSAALINTEGVWANPTGSILTLLPMFPDIVSGVGTDTLAWGIRHEDGGFRQSSWVFQGVSADPLPPDPDGAVFELGTFIHNNIPIKQSEPDFPSDDDFTGADLLLNVELSNGSIFSQNFLLSLTHEETPNTLPCCADLVVLPAVAGGGMVTIDGLLYEFDIFGFKDVAAGPFVDTLSTEEGESNSTKIFGSLSRVTAAVPEPSTMWLFGTALAALFTTVRRRR